MSFCQKNKEVVFDPSMEMLSVINKIEMIRRRLIKSSGVNWYIKTNGAILIAFLVLLYLLFGSSFESYIDVVSIALFSYFFYVLYKIKTALQRQHSIYIQQVILPMLNGVISASRYSRRGCIFTKYQREFTNAFPKLKVENSEDLVEGKINGVDMAFGEIQIRPDLGTVIYGNRSNTTSLGAVFRLLGNAFDKKREENSYFCFVADFNKRLDAYTVLKSKSIDFPLKINTLSSKKILLENRKFNETWETYSHNEVESRYILTPSFMEKMLNINTILQGYFWFQDSKIMFLGNFRNTEVNLFDIDIDKSIYEQTKATYMAIHQLKAIVNELNLNSIIWKS